MTITLCCFLPPDGAAPHAALVTRDAVVVQRGDLADLVAHKFDRSVLVLPGDDMALLSRPVPSGTPAQRIAAARLMLKDAVSSQGEGVAVGPDTGGQSWIAVLDEAAVAAAIARAAEHGLDPDVVVPAPLLLTPPMAGAKISQYGHLHIVSTDGRAFAAEPDMIQAILGDSPIETLDEAQSFQALVDSLCSTWPINLRIGALQRGGAPRFPEKALKLAAALAAVCALVWPAIPLVEAARYRQAAAALDKQSMDVVKTALPDAPRIVNARAQLDEKMATLGLGLGSSERRLAALLNAVAQADGASIETLSMRSGEDLSATLSANSQAQLQAIGQSLAAAVYVFQSSPIRPTGGGPRSDITVRLR
ncbi:MAG: type II secretion system protein GspL [Sphingomonadales bacterium]